MIPYCLLALHMLAAQATPWGGTCYEVTLTLRNPSDLEVFWQIDEGGVALDAPGDLQDVWLWVDKPLAGELAGKSTTTITTRLKGRCLEAGNAVLPSGQEGVTLSRRARPETSPPACKRVQTIRVEVPLDTAWAKPITRCPCAVAVEVRPDGSKGARYVDCGPGNQPLILIDERERAAFRDTTAGEVPFLPAPAPDAVREGTYVHYQATMRCIQAR